ncbi:adenylosuccinate synthetase [Mycobacterium talmoniae]|uniref:Adenylosuccinate synthetase n=1 Tax=Mycobacterium talmoniae TaxID=1858794 RepID=A0A1S1NMG0_9MYCO|nr:adenylosuccinate synthetase [Mycobacterium talmoniae]OHV05327.1 adenylosuccinate synthetase [Mycobacterium talmoniae]
MPDNIFGDRHPIVVDLGFGDAGKGATVDWLCSPAAGLDVAAVVRFNGGAQAAHNVVVGEVHHTFSQFGSGTLSGIATFLSAHMLVEPIALAGEARDLAALGVADPLGLLAVDAAALLTTPIHVAANRAREDARGAARHGSCGKGIGETAGYALEHDAPTVGDCRHPDLLAAKLTALAAHYAGLLAGSPHRYPALDAMVEMYREFAGTVEIVGPGYLRSLAGRGRLMFEGAQGVLLDEWRGLHPHTTWSTVEPSHARAMLAEIGQHGYVLGVTRSYLTRHGAGPFPTEDPALGALLPEPHNGTGAYQGAFRVGAFDPLLLRYAIAACGGVDGLAVTHLDALDRAPLRAAVGYRTAAGPLTGVDCGPWRDLGYQRRLTDLLATADPVLGPVPASVEGFLGYVERALGSPVVLGADGPDRADRAVRALAVAA